MGVVKNSWSKDFGNGTTLREFKIYKFIRHRNPIAFVQVGYFNETTEVIGTTISENGKEAKELFKY